MKLLRAKSFLVIPMSLFALEAFLSTLSVADVATPTETTIYFTRDGKPVNEHVSFSVTCTGRMQWPGQQDRPPESGQIYSFSADCPHYGCKISESYYLNYKHIEYCSMDGTVDGKPFKLDDYGDSPIDFSKCSYPNSKAQHANVKRQCTATFELP